MLALLAASLLAAAPADASPAAPGRAAVRRLQSAARGGRHALRERVRGARELRLKARADGIRLYVDNVSLGRAPGLEWIRVRALDDYLAAVGGADLRIDARSEPGPRPGYHVSGVRLAKPPRPGFTAHLIHRSHRSPGRVETLRAVRSITVTADSGVLGMGMLYIDGERAALFDLGRLDRLEALARALRGGPRDALLSVTRGEHGPELAALELGP